MIPRCTRLAPSPTGALHLGNATTFLINWAIARSNDWEIIMRIEDLNGPRVKPEAIHETLDILQWLGLDWDGEVHMQSQGLQCSKVVLENLIETNHVYHCNLSRKQIEEATSAPHKSGELNHVAIRPNNIRQHNLDSNIDGSNWRFVVPNTNRTVTDQICGSVELSLNQDFIVWTRQGTPSYQLAVVVDDHRQGVTDVVRGNDLLMSAAWQELIYSAMGWETPNWHHLPLILGADGKRLAKRHGDTRLTTYREQGVTAERIIALIAKWCNIIDDRSDMDANTFTQLLDTAKIPRDDIVFTEMDDAWLVE